MPFLLDSNILIYFFKDVGAVRTHFRQHKDTDIKICTPVLWELMTGAYKAQDGSGQTARLAAVQNRFETLTFDLSAAEHAAKARAHLEALGTPIGPIDTMIAGIALANQLTMVTRNVREFERVPGLQVHNWYET
jgi:tRNA(fMet)-specific endonuclease VapC